jgi:hypothetical protein
MHNRASLKGIAAVLEDSTPDNSKPKAFKTPSSFLFDIVGSIIL